MNKNINHILEKYWNGETSLEEESTLKSYFASDEIAEEHKDVAPLFVHFAAVSAMTTDVQFPSVVDSDTVTAAIDRYWAGTSSTVDENLISKYISEGEVAVEHSELIPLFQYFEIQRSQTSDLSLSIDDSVPSVDISALIEKYFEAETTVEEENALHKYFAGSDVAPEHSDLAGMFGYFTAQRAQVSDAQLNITEPDTDIDALLDKYWKAETSLQEEQVLAAYFNSGEVDDKHREYLAVFSYYDTQKASTTERNYEAALQSSTSEAMTGGNSKSDSQSETKVRALRRYISAIAAILVLGIAAVTVMNQNQEPEYKYKGKFVQLDEEAEAKEAYEITKQAFALLSKNMQQGSATVQQSVKKAETASIFR